MINNLAFKSNIRLITNARYNKLVRNDENFDKKHVDIPYSIKSAKTGNKLYTGQAFYCTAGALTNQNESYLFHINPLLNQKEPPSLNKEYIASASKNLASNSSCKEKNELNGILVGGLSTNNDETKNDYDIELKAKKSENLFKELKKTLKDNTNNLSIIWGQKKGEWPQTNVIAIGEKDPVTGYKDTFLVATGSGYIREQNTINSPEELQKAYEHIHISPNDHLYIGEPGDKDEMELTKEAYPEFFQPLDDK